MLCHLSTDDICIETIPSFTYIIGNLPKYVYFAIIYQLFGSTRDPVIRDEYYSSTKFIQ